MPTVSMPSSLDISATIGAAPVPVPPPMPHVTNTISDPLTISVISSLFSSAAALPTSGSAPAPRPFVSFSPTWRQTGALQFRRCCLSVLMQTNSTPCIPSSIIRLTALFPPPPTPITKIFAAKSASFVFISNNVAPPSIMQSHISLTYIILIH